MPPHYESRRWADQIADATVAAEHWFITIFERTHYSAQPFEYFLLMISDQLNQTRKIIFPVLPTSWGWQKFNNKWFYRLNVLIHCTFHITIAQSTVVKAFTGIIENKYTTVPAYYTKVYFLWISWAGRFWPAIAKTGIFTAIHISSQPPAQQSQPAR